MQKYLMSLLNGNNPEELMFILIATNLIILTIVDILKTKANEQTIGSQESNYIIWIFWLFILYLFMFGIVNDAYENHSSYYYPMMTFQGIVGIVFLRFSFKEKKGESEKSMAVKITKKNELLDNKISTKKDSKVDELLKSLNKEYNKK